MSINFEKINNKDYLLSLLNNLDELSNIIHQTQGFILKNMQDFKILPPIDFLLNNISVYTIEFIYDNYTLSPEQELYIEKQKYDYKDENENIPLTKDEIFQFLKEEKKIPQGRTTNIPVEFWINHPDLIIKQSSLRDDGYSSFNDESFIERFFPENELTEENFLKLPAALLERFPSFFKFIPNLLKNPTYKESYVHYLKISHDKYGNYQAMHLGNFLNYTFTNDDKDFLFSILNNTRDFYLPKYKHLSTNIKQYIDEVTYTIDYLHSYDKFSKEEVIQYKKQIQNAILNEHHYFRNSDLLYLKISDENYDIIFDKDFINRIIDKIKEPGISFVYQTPDRDYASQQTRNFKLMDKLIDIAVENKDIEFFAQFGPKNVFEIYGNVIDNYGTPDNIKEVYSDKLNNFLTNIYQHFFTSDLIFHSNIDNLKSSYNNSRINENIFDFVFANYLNENIFYFTIQKYVDNKIKHNINEYIDFASTKISSSSIKKILNFYKNNDFKIQSDEKKLDLKIKSNSIPAGNFDVNFLNFENQPIESIQSNQELFRTLLSTSPDFRSHILNIKYIISEDFLVGLFFTLNKIKDDIETDKIKNKTNAINQIKSIETFLYSYIGNNKAQFLNSSTLLDKAIKLEHGTKILNIDHTQQMESKYKSFIEHLDIISKYEIETALIKDIDYKSSQYLQHEESKKIARDLFTSFDSQFIDDKFKELTDAKEFSRLYQFSIFAEQKYTNLLYNQIKKLSFNETFHLIDNPLYLKLFNSTTYGNDKNKNKAIFNEFNDDENYQLAEKLLKYSRQKHSGKYYIIQFLDFFTNPSQSFIKKFAINEMPNETLWSSQLHYNDSDRIYGSQYVNTPYSNQEIIQLFNSIPLLTILKNSEQNDRVSDFFAANFNNIDSLKSFLDFTKNDYPELYLLAVGQKIFYDIVSLNYREHRELNKDDKQEILLTNGISIRHNSEIAANKLFSELVDLDVCFRGFDKIYQTMDKHDNTNSLIGSNIIKQIFQNFVWATYGDYRDDNTHQTIYHSFLTYEQTDKIIEYFIEKSPILLLNFHVIGKSDKIENYISKNIDRFGKLIDLSALITPQSDHAYNLNIDLSGYYAEQFESIMKSLINYFLDTAISNDASINKILYLDYLHTNNEKLENFEFTYKKNQKQTYTNYISKIKDEETLKSFKIFVKKIQLERKILQNDIEQETKPTTKPKKV